MKRLHSMGNTSDVSSQDAVLMIIGMFLATNKRNYSKKFDRIVKIVSH